MNKVLFLVGPHASGKTYSSKKYIAKKENVGMIDTGPIMRELHNKMDPRLSMEEWVNNLEVQYGKDITSQLISTEIGKIMLRSEYDHFILIGFRTLEGIIYAVKHLNLEDFSILYVDANLELLYGNYLKREKTDISLGAFQDYLENELKSGLVELRRIAISDDSRIDYYYRNSNNDGFEEKIDSHFSETRVKRLEWK